MDSGLIHEAIWLLNLRPVKDRLDAVRIPDPLLPYARPDRSERLRSDACPGQLDWLVFFSARKFLRRVARRRLVTSR